MNLQPVHVADEQKNSRGLGRSDNASPLGISCRRLVSVAFKLPADWQFSQQSSDGFGSIRWADEATIEQLFHDDGPRRSRFLRHLATGATGIILHDDDQWIAYGWLSLPNTVGVPHFAGKMRRVSQNYFWIFHCHTRQEYRGRGIYGVLLQRLAQHARSIDPNAEVYVDTSAENIPARRAILRTGFVPCGRVVIYKMSLLGRTCAWSRWNRQADHPAVGP